jgi:hypothetical protein
MMLYYTLRRLNVNHEINNPTWIDRIHRIIEEKTSPLICTD